MDGSYFSVKVRLSSQVMMGRLRRSLKVGRITVYLSLVAIVRWKEVVKERGVRGFEGVTSSWDIDARPSMAWEP